MINESSFYVKKNTYICLGLLKIIPLLKTRPPNFWNFKEVLRDCFNINVTHLIVYTKETESAYLGPETRKYIFEIFLSF